MSDLYDILELDDHLEILLNVTKSKDDYAITDSPVKIYEISYYAMICPEDDGADVLADWSNFVAMPNPKFVIDHIMNYLKDKYKTFPEKVTWKKARNREEYKADNITIPLSGWKDEHENPISAYIDLTVNFKQTAFLRSIILPKE